MPRLTSTTSRQFSVAAPDQSKQRFVSTDFAGRTRLQNPGAAGSNFGQHFFGGCVAIWRDHYVAGAFADQNGGAANVGRAYLVNAATQTAVANWLEPTLTTNTLYASPNPGGAPLNLHNPVALNSTRVFVGASQNATGGSNRGVVHVFLRADNSLETTIASPGTNFGWFGATLACTDRWLIVGSPGHNPGSNPEQGRVYVLDIEDSFSVAQTINISTANTTQARFGNAIAVYGNYLIAGEPNWLVPEGGLNINNNGRCRVWTLDPFELIYTKENPNPTGTVALDVFGTAVAISENYFAASAPGEDTAGNNQGVVYVFDLSTGDLARTLENPNEFPTTATDDYFGNRIALTDQYVAVAATEERALDNIGNPEQDHGVVYLFNTATGDLIETYQNPVFNSQALMNQGMGLAMNDQFLVIGAPGFNNNVGFAEVYKLGLPSASYSVSAAANNVNEGSALTFTVATANIRNGTVLGWRILDRPEDFLVNTGTVEINSNSGTFTVTPLEDLLTEGTETFRVEISRLTGTVLAASSAITINDTSTATITVTPQSLTLDEGDSVTVDVSVVSEDIPDGFVLYWTSSSPDDTGIDSGSFEINNDAGSFTVTVANDFLTEGTETFTVSVRSGSITGTVIATSDAITVNDTSVETYAISAAANNVDEGSPLVFTVSTQGVPNGSTLYWTVSATDDFNPNSGSFTVVANTGTFTVTPTRDAETEGTETFTASVRTGSISGSVVATSSSVTINDTSLDPTYEIQAETSTVNEGYDLVFQVNTTDVFDGTTLYWTITNSGDFSAGSGSFVINDDTGTFTVSVTSDLADEGSETFTASVRTGSVGGTIVATSSEVTINDTSFPATVTPAANNVNEGVSLLFNVTTEGRADGTTLYWTVSSPSDFDVTSGSFSVTGNAGSFSVTPKRDRSVNEGSETFTVSIRSVGTGGEVLATSSEVTINDTSRALQILYTVPGTHTFVAPTGVTSVSVVAIGGGGSGGANSGAGGGGGGLGWKNNITVTPGQEYTVVVGAGGARRTGMTSGSAGGNSYFIDTSTVAGFGGLGGGSGPGGVSWSNGVNGGTYAGDGGGNGGSSGGGAIFSAGGGGGGAGGYSGDGGDGGFAGNRTFTAGTNGSGGAGGGGAANLSSGADRPTGPAGGSGGGVNVLGILADGVGGTSAGQGGGGGSTGSGGSNGASFTTNLRGGSYGGGGGGGSNQNFYSNASVAGGNGAVRIVWSGSTYPDYHSDAFVGE